MAKGNVNPDFDTQHPDWVKQAQQKNYTDLKNKIKDMVERKQDNAMRRRDKLAGKN